MCRFCGISLSRIESNLFFPFIVQVCGKDWWFQAHRGLMSLALVLTVVAFAVIASDKGFLDYSSDFVRDNPHPVVGMVTVLGVIVQPIMALFRCHPGTTFRYGTTISLKLTVSHLRKKTFLV